MKPHTNLGIGDKEMEAYERCRASRIRKFLWKCLIANRIYGYLLAIINLSLPHNFITCCLFLLSTVPTSLKPTGSVEEGFFNVLGVALQQQRGSTTPRFRGGELQGLAELERRARKRQQA